MSHTQSSDVAIVGGGLDKTRQTLERFLFGLANQDTAAIESLLAADVHALSDGAGEFFAARVPIIGRERVMRFYINTS